MPGLVDPAARARRVRQRDGDGLPARVLDGNRAADDLVESDRSEESLDRQATDRNEQRRPQRTKLPVEPVGAEIPLATRGDPIAAPARARARVAARDRGNVERVPRPGLVEPGALEPAKERLPGPAGERTLVDGLGLSRSLPDEHRTGRCGTRNDRDDTVVPAQSARGELGRVQLQPALQFRAPCHRSSSFAHASAARVARRQSRTPAPAAAAPGPGVNRRALRLARNAPGSGQTPVASPANPAAPSAVVSTISGRSTGMPSTSAWNCISQSLAVAPPSTRSGALPSSEPGPTFATIASSTSFVEYAIASSDARARCARPVPRVRPTIVPRALASQCGAPSPTSAGTKYTPPVFSTLRASGSVSAAASMIPRPSRSHCTAAPAMKIDASSAYAGRPVASQATVVRRPPPGAGRTCPALRSRNAPVP